MSTFNHEEIDKKYQEKWENESVDDRNLVPDSASNSFNMILPPPNITGTLHLGHALNITIQDTIARYQQLKGMNVTWIPGVDHAGIATQVVVERQLMKDTGETRHDLGRDGFLNKVWEWKEKNNNTIRNQLKIQCPILNVVR
jgi:valyl-tRNA synthetase